MTNLLLGAKFFWNFWSHPLSAGGSPCPHNLMVNTFTRNVLYDCVDFVWQARIAPSLVRTYNSQSNVVGAFGMGWTFNLGERLVDYPSTIGALEEVAIWYVDGKGTAFPMVLTNPGGGIGDPWDVTPASLDNFMAVVLDTPTGRLLTLTERNGLQHHFDADGRLARLEDPNGNTLHCRYAEGDTGINKRLVEVYTIIDSIEYSLIDTWEYAENTTLGLWLCIKAGHSVSQTFWQYRYDNETPVWETDHFELTGDGYLTQLTDPLGQRWQYGYDEVTGDVYTDSDPVDWPEETVDWLWLTSIRDPNGGVTAITGYDWKSLLDQPNWNLIVVDGEGGETSFADAAITAGTGVTSSYSDPRGHVWSYVQDDSFRLTSFASEVTTATTYSYGAQNLPTTITDPNSNVTTYTYDTDGNVTQVNPPVGSTVDYTYTTEGGRRDLVSSMTVDSTPDLVTDYEYDDSGNLISQTSPLGYTQEWEYYPNGDLYRAFSAQQVADGKNGWTQYEYDPVYGTQTQQTNSVGAVWVTEYEPQGRFPRKQTDPLGNTTSYVYDDLGRMLSSCDPLGNMTSQSYDALGSVVEEVHGCGSATTHVYDWLNRRVSTTDPLGSTTRWTYDRNGNVLTTTNALGEVSASTYDAANRRDTATVGVGTALEQTIIYVYDDNGNLRATEPREVPPTSDHWRWNVYYYDELNRQVASTDVAFDGADPETRFEALLTAVDIDSADVRTSSTVYDAIGRVMATLDPQGNTDLSIRGTITRVVDSVTLPPSPVGFEVAGDWTALAGAKCAIVFGSTGNDGVYTVVEVTEAGGTSFIETLETPPDSIADGTLLLAPTSAARYDADSRRVTSINALGVAAHTVYNADGAVLQEYAPGQTVCEDRPVSENRYDALGRLSERLDAMGFATTLTYDLAGRQVAVSDPRGNSWRTEYDAAGRQIAQINPLGATTSQTLNADGQPTATTDPVGNVTRYAYDKAGRRVSVTTPRGYLTRYTYDALGRQVAMTAPNGGVTRTEYDALGRRVSTFDVFDNETAYTYDLLNRVLTVTDPLTNETSYEYAGWDEPTTQTLPDTAEIVTTYNKNGRPLTVDTPDGNTMTYVYDALMRVLTQTDSGPHVTTFGYNDSGRLLTTTYPNALVVTNTYDPKGQVVRREKSGLGEAIPDEFETWTFDPNGNQLTYSDANGHVWQFAYDAANRLSHTTNPEFTPADPHVATRQYNAAGQLISRTDYLGQTITQSYNADGQLAEIVYPDAAKVRYDWTCCRLSRMVDATGTSLFTYDLANRLVGAVDANKQMVSYQYNANGQPTRVLLPGERSVERTYSPLGKVAEVTDPDAAVSTFSYLDGGQMSEIDLGAVKQLPLTWDGTLGLLEHVRLAPLPSLNVELYTPVDSAYPTASPLDVTWQQGFASLNSTLTARSDMRLLTELHDHVVGGTSIYFQKDYGYDPTGNLTSQLDQVPTPNTITAEYYNRANFLTGFKTVNDPPSPGQLSLNPHNVLTDRNGNIKQIKKVVSDVGPAYFTWNFSFDAENRLIEARGFDEDTDETTILEFAYDGLGRRVITRENGVGHWYVYDGDQLVQDRGERTDELLVEYTYGPTPTGPSAIFKQNRGGQERFFYTSPQGGFPRYAFDETGTLTDWLQYSAFGELVFHEASGTETEIEVGAFGLLSIATDGPSPVLLGARLPIALLPDLGMPLSKTLVFARGSAQCRTGCSSTLPPSSQSVAMLASGGSLQLDEDFVDPDPGIDPWRDYERVPGNLLPTRPSEPAPEPERPDSPIGDLISDFIGWLKSKVKRKIKQTVMGPLTQFPSTLDYYGCASSGGPQSNDCYWIASLITNPDFLKSCCESGGIDCNWLDHFECWLKHSEDKRWSYCPGGGQEGPCKSAEGGANPRHGGDGPFGAPQCTGWLACFFCKCNIRDLQAALIVDCGNDPACYIQATLELLAGWRLKCTSRQCN